jgi:hypothetical protein
LFCVRRNDAIGCAGQGAVWRCSLLFRNISLINASPMAFVGCADQGFDAKSCEDTARKIVAGLGECSANAGGNVTIEAAVWDPVGVVLPPFADNFAAYAKAGTDVDVMSVGVLWKF